jgi:UDP-N-acetylglucosamine acyltransferase
LPAKGRIGNVLAINRQAIHPTAVVHKKAQIGEDCHIGPYCVIGEHVVLGARSRLHSHVVIDGHTRLGEENEIYPFASIGLKTQDLKWRGGITRTEIGNRNTIRECVTIHSATGDGEATVVGSDNNILASSHVAHNVQIGNHVIISMAALAGHVVVEDYALVGGLAAVHQFCRIGKMAIIGGGSAVGQDILPFMMARGYPAAPISINKVGLDRNGVSKEAQMALKQAFKILIREGLTIPNAVARLEKKWPGLPEIEYLVNFVRKSDRGFAK